MEQDRFVVRSVCLFFMRLGQLLWGAWCALPHGMPPPGCGCLAPCTQNRMHASAAPLWPNRRPLSMTAGDEAAVEPAVGGPPPPARRLQRTTTMLAYRKVR